MSGDVGCELCGKPLPRDPKANGPYPWTRCLSCELKTPPERSADGKGNPATTLDLEALATVSRSEREAIYEQQGQSAQPRGRRDGAGGVAPRRRAVA